MQSMLGVSFLNTRPTSLENSTAVNSFESDKSSNINELNGESTVFNQIFQQQFLPVSSESDSDLKQLLPINQHAQNGEDLPIELMNIGKNFSQFKTIDDLKKSLEVDGLDPIFFDIKFDGVNLVEIQPVEDAVNNQAPLQLYSSVVLMRLPVSESGEQSEGEDVGAIEQVIAEIFESQLEVKEGDNFLKQYDHNQINEFTHFNSPVFLQRINGNVESGSEQTVDELEELSQSMDPEILHSTDYAQIKQFIQTTVDQESTRSDHSIALIVVPNSSLDAQISIEGIEGEGGVNQKTLGQFVPNHLSEQIFSQSYLLSSANADQLEEGKLEQPATLSNPLNELNISDEMDGIDAMKTKNVKDEASKLSPQTLFEAIEETGDMDEKSEEGSSDENVQLKEPTKTRRAMQSDQIAQIDKPVVSKSTGHIELAPITLSDAKETLNAIKSLQNQAGELINTVLPEKHAVKLTEEVGSRVMMLHQQKLTQAFIRIDPPELGALEIHIETKGDEAKVTIVTQQVNVKEALDSQANRLREMLHEQGFEQVDVDVKEQNQSNTNDDSNSEDAGEKMEEDDEVSTSENARATHLVDQFV